MSEADMSGLDDWHSPELDWCESRACPYWEWDVAKGTRHQTNELHKGFIRLWNEMEKAKAEDRVLSTSEARKRLGIVYGNIEMGRRKTDDKNGDWRDKALVGGILDGIRANDRHERRKRIHHRWVIGLSVVWVVLVVVSVTVMIVQAATG